MYTANWWLNIPNNCIKKLYVYDLVEKKVWTLLSYNTMSFALFRPYNLTKTIYVIRIYMIQTCINLSRCYLICIGISIVEMRWSHGGLICTMIIPTEVRSLYWTLPLFLHSGMDWSQNHLTEVWSIWLYFAENIFKLILWMKITKSLFNILWSLFLIVQLPIS